MIYKGEKKNEHHRICQQKSGYVTYGPVKEQIIVLK
jgi:hypothetical protein